MWHRLGVLYTWEWYWIRVTSKHSFMTSETIMLVYYNCLLLQLLWQTAKHTRDMLSLKYFQLFQVLGNVLIINWLVCVYFIVAAIVSLNYLAFLRTWSSNRPVYADTEGGQWFFYFEMELTISITWSPNHKKYTVPIIESQLLYTKCWHSCPVLHTVLPQNCKKGYDVWCTVKKLIIFVLLSDTNIKPYVNHYFCCWNQPIWTKSCVSVYV